MSLRGRTPKPTRLKELEGNPGKRKLNKREPKFAPSSTDAPPGLDKDAREEWARVAPQLAAQKMLTIPDRTMLAAYCRSYSRWLKAERFLDEEGVTFETAQGYRQQQPEVGIANRYFDRMCKLAAEFGFTPASRVRLDIKPAEGAANPDDDFFRYKGEAPGQGETPGSRLEH